MSQNNTTFNTKFQEYYTFYEIDLNDITKERRIKGKGCFLRSPLREDIKNIPVALSNGWEVIEGRHFADCNTFKKRNKTVWYCRKGWAVADLINDFYENHRYYQSLDEALRIEA